MIVVVGSPSAEVVEDASVAAGGVGARIAIAAARAGAPVQVVGRVGEDPDGDGVLLDLARHGVGHVAVLRDAGRPTRRVVVPPLADILDDAAGGSGDTAAHDEPTLDAADLELALSYLTEYAVIVVAESLGQAAMRVVADAAAWGSAALVVVVGVPDELSSVPESATVFEPPADGNPDGAFATIVGAYAAALDRGEDPRTAFDAATAAVGSTAAD